MQGEGKARSKYLETLYIVMPTYNEEANIRDVVSSWYPILEYGDEKSRIVVSDGGSTDRTLEILYDLQKTYPRLVVLSNPGTDHGTKVMILYKYAIENNANWIFQTDSDGQTLPSEFEEFWDERNHYDAVIGNRKVRGDGSDRKFVENVLRLVLLVFFGKVVPDANAPFRLMKKTLVSRYIDLMPDGFPLPNAVLTEAFVKYNENVSFREITFQPRQGGKNYMNWKRIFKIGWESLANFHMVRKNMKYYERKVWNK